MTFPTYSPAQTEPPLDPRQSLPTMYDLPSEDPKEPGLPDTVHLDRPQLLEFTFLPPGWDAEQVFTASDLNLYYDEMLGASNCTTTDSNVEAFAILLCKQKFSSPLPLSPPQSRYTI